MPQNRESSYHALLQAHALGKSLSGCVLRHERWVLIPICGFRRNPSLGIITQPTAIGCGTNCFTRVRSQSPTVSALLPFQRRSSANLSRFPDFQTIECAGRRSVHRIGHTLSRPRQIRGSVQRCKTLQEIRAGPHTVNPAGNRVPAQNLF